MTRWLRCLFRCHEWDTLVEWWGKNDAWPTQLHICTKCGKLKTTRVIF